MSLVRSTIRLFSTKNPSKISTNGFYKDLLLFHNNSNNKSVLNNTNRNSRKGFLIATGFLTTTNNTSSSSSSAAVIDNKEISSVFFQHYYEQLKLKQKNYYTTNTTNNCNIQRQHNHHQQQKRNFSTLQNTYFSPMKNNHDNSNSGRRTIITHEITKNLTLFSNKPRNVDKNSKTLKLKEQVERPLVLMFGWMMATKKNLAKYAYLYTDLGFDVLTVEISPWQLLWPVKGSQIVALDVLKFLESNPLYTPIVLHGFSVGGYVWGEVMVHMAREQERYKPLLDRMVAQVWDSAADITEIPIGVPKAIFPRNQTLQKALKNYMIYHLKTFHEQATCHYIRSSQMFHSPLVKTPALFLLSKNDPIGAEQSNLSAKESMESIGIKCTWKCWDRSGHVQHFRYHREEYIKYLLNHLENNVMERIKQKSQIKM